MSKFSDLHIDLGMKFTELLIKEELKVLEKDEIKMLRKFRQIADNWNISDLRSADNDFRYDVARDFLTDSIELTDQEIYQIINTELLTNWKEG